jgi:hypothetical protein
VNIQRPGTEDADYHQATSVQCVSMRRRLAQGEVRDSVKALEERAPAVRSATLITINRGTVGDVGGEFSVSSVPLRSASAPPAWPLALSATPNRTRCSRSSTVGTRARSPWRHVPGNRDGPRFHRGCWPSGRPTHRPGSCWLPTRLFASGRRLPPPRCRGPGRSRCSHRPRRESGNE